MNRVREHFRTVVMQLIIVLLVFLLLIGALTVGLRSAIPQRWYEPLVGLNRGKVHAVLGLPDGNFMPKGWEGWTQSALVGAWVLLVYYNDSEQVVDAKRKFHWGLDYMRWEHDYRKQMDKLR